MPTQRRSCRTTATGDSDGPNLEPHEESPAGETLPGAKTATVTIRIPSRAIPAAGIVSALVSIFSSVACNLYYGHDIGGLYWPYISDTAKEPPQAGLFSFGRSRVASGTLFHCLLVDGWSQIILWIYCDFMGVYECF